MIHGKMARLCILSQSMLVIQLNSLIVYGSFISSTGIACKVQVSNHERRITMSVFCQNCGAELASNANFCPQCGASVNGYSTAAEQGSGMSNAAKTAATVGGVVAGAAVLNSLSHRLVHRRRPMYHGPMGGPPPRRGPGPGPGFGGPGGRGGGRR